jgi:hypothetical protein
MTKAQSICRNASPQRPFTQILNTLLRDYGLSLDATGFLVRFLAMPPDWRASLEWARSKFGIGEQKCERVVKELIAAGYCRKKPRERNPDGSFCPVLYEFTDLAHVFGDADFTVAPETGVMDRHAVKTHPVGDPPVGNHPGGHHAVKTTPYTNIEETKKEEQTLEQQAARDMHNVTQFEEREELFPPAEPLSVRAVSFEEFWKAYPVKKGCGPAKKRWATLSPADRLAALQAIPAYTASEKPQSGYVQQGDTYLSKKTWLDDLSPAKTKTKSTANGHDSEGLSLAALEAMKQRRANKRKGWEPVASY